MDKENANPIVEVGSKRDASIFGAVPLRTPPPPSLVHRRRCRRWRQIPADGTPTTPCHVWQRRRQRRRGGGRQDSPVSCGGCRSASTSPTSPRGSRCPFCTSETRATDFNCLVTHAENISTTFPKVGTTVNVHSFRAKHRALGMHLRSLQRVEISAGRMPPLKPKAPKGSKSNKWRQSQMGKDFSNYMPTIDTAAKTNKDMSLLLAEFEKVKKDDADFFCKLDLDHDDRYALHTIIGINRYGQSIQLGCGFLRNEQEADYVWLFEAFLEAMDGVQPMNIITDQDGAMRNAIATIFPDACHRNCRWHIMQNAQPVLGNEMAKNEPLRLEFNATIDYSMTLGDVQAIPTHYILPRWTMPPDDIVQEKMELPDVPADRKLSNKERKLLRYGTLCNNWTDYAKIASESEKGTALADKYMRELGKELTPMKITAAAKRKEKKKQGKDQGVPSMSELGGDAGQGSSTQYQHVRDPIMTSTKGRPEEKRKKSGLHLKASKPPKCKGCGSAQHSTAECPSKITPSPEPKEFNFFRDMI
ncbi:hypothetical protein QYE76_023537 [Lolium multiflorum]|uniref:MULE transposase domain-containing protein n=1 Tax=Lolium multiflorum TaxID=4521 RepID=A0AAD8VUU4_LOLMU|nr:hypothetical protein QYE76_023537 [Lolium multiflorum]